jgi:hypothetical protein
VVGIELVKIIRINESDGFQQGMVLLEAVRAESRLVQVRHPVCLPQSVHLTRDMRDHLCDSELESIILCVHCVSARSPM